MRRWYWIACALLALLLAACHKSKQPAEAEYHRLGYILLGDNKSVMAPVSVKSNNDNVRIQLKDSAPLPHVTRVSPNGTTNPFDAQFDGHALIVPIAYKQLQLRFESPDLPSIDISYTVQLRSGLINCCSGE